MSIAPSWRAGTKAAARREEAVRRLLRGQDPAQVKRDLGLDNYDSRLVADYVRHAGAAERRQMALEALRAGEHISSVRDRIALSKTDERLIAQQVRTERPWLAVVVLDPEDSDAEWFCPGISPHEATPVPECRRLAWHAEFPGDGRVVEHTCNCGMTEYELISYGGLYRIRRTTARTDIPPVSYTHGWHRPEAYDWWRRLLSGYAR